ncbi:MAG: murein biosynthesis integral membrane protein MurJ [Deltaproteobacteria bacterium]|nr:murein biosynthesis integral membrane protein MurJ [Deltaproteobacteria bacterium]
MVAVAILLSKLVGLIRQRFVAHYFGTSAVADVIAAAFRVGNLAQNLLGEGTLSASFIPVYAKLRAKGREAEAIEFARAALGLLAVAVIVVSGLGVALAPWLAIVVAPGFDAAKLAMTTRLVRIVFPMTGLLVLCAWALGVLNAHRKFFLPYVAPVIWSAAQIAALLVGGGWLLLSGEALARVLALGALVGATLELGTLLRRCRPLLGTLRPSLDHLNPAVRTAAKRLPAVLLGRGVIQISGLIDTMLVSFLGTGSNAVFGYAQMLYLLPMSVLGTGEAAVSLPEMARDSAEEDVERRNERLRARLGAMLTRVTVLAVPAMAVLILFGAELITLLLRTGRFDADSTHRVAEALAVYGFALLGNASGRLFATSFFALGETRLPARFAVARVVTSTVLALLLMRELGVVGVVLGATTAGWLEALLLGWQLRKRIGGLGLEALPVWRIMALAVVVFGVPAALRASLAPSLFRDGPLGALLLLAVAGTVFLAAATGLKLLDLRSWLRRGR